VTDKAFCKIYIQVCNETAQRIAFLPVHSLFPYTSTNIQKLRANNRFWAFVGCQTVSR
jgi:hypothetical protein